MYVIEINLYNVQTSNSGLAYTTSKYSVVKSPSVGTALLPWLKEKTNANF